MLIDKKPQYRRPEILKRIYRLKNANMPKAEIARRIGKEFDVDTPDSQTIDALYEEYVTKGAAASTLEKKEHAEAFNEWSNLMKRKFKQIDQATNSLMEAIKIVSKELTPKEYLKMTPTILAVCKEILNQLHYLKKDQEKITINQKNVIYSPLEIMNVINKKIDEEERSGRVVINYSKVADKEDSEEELEKEANRLSLEAKKQKQKQK